MTVTIGPGSRLKGTVRVPGDKSIAHRGLIFGALAHGWTRLSGVPRSADVDATVAALRECGVGLQRNGDAVIVQGFGHAALRADGATINCANSGTTMRLLMGIFAALPVSVSLTGDESLSRRPMRRIAEPLQRMGARIDLAQAGTAPVRVRGTAALHAAEHDLAVASAQLKNALLLAGLFANGRTRLRGALRSRDHGERLLRHFGAKLAIGGGEIAIDGGQRLRGAFLQIPGDPSSAAFMIAAAVLSRNASVELPGVALNPTRLGFVRALQRMGADVEVRRERDVPEPAGTLAARSSELRGIELGRSEIPAIIDELPLLAAMATAAKGRTVVRGAAELRVKESDRIETLAEALRALGGNVETFEDGFAIEGPQRLHGGCIHARGDHRIAMTAAVASLAGCERVTLSDAQCVAVSYPGFFSDLESMGAHVA